MECNEPYGLDGEIVCATDIPSHSHESIPLLYSNTNVGSNEKYTAIARSHSTYALVYSWRACLTIIVIRIVLRHRRLSTIRYLLLHRFVRLSIV